ncbi:hypothetical protein [Francisella tularensis]|uniref:hypothetical protein n=1 Tax=Francisella tularensis TaxID=263 RepID=UPI0008F4983C|nr:hypothetical protein [Francisella tularensis]
MEKKEYIESKESLYINVGGDNSIDSDVLVDILKNTAYLLDVSSNVLCSNSYVKLSVKSTQQGSFEFVTDVVTKYAPDLLQAIEYGCVIIGGVASFISIKKHLLGEKPRKITTYGNKTDIENVDGNVITVDKYIANEFFSNNKIENSIINITNHIGNNKRDSYNLTSKNSNVSINKDDALLMRKRVVTPEDEISEVAELKSENVVTDYYRLLTPTSKRGIKWEFLDNDAKIKCIMSDDVFFDSYVLNNVRLGGSELFYIRMLVRTYMSDGKIKKEYEILEILDHKVERGLIL